jgi:hypothetical protein
MITCPGVREKPTSTRLFKYENMNQNPLRTVQELTIRTVNPQANQIPTLLTTRH